MDYITLRSPSQEAIINTFRPTFVFDHQSVTYNAMGIQVSVSPAFSSILIESDTSSNPSEWSFSPMVPGVTHSFTFPVSKLIAPNGVYFWRMWAFDTSLPGYRLSDVRLLVVSDAVYPWSIDGVNIRAASNGIEQTDEIVGCLKNVKRTWKITLTPMTESEMLILKAAFDVNVVHYFTDNLNNHYNVFWGECERNIDGMGFKPTDSPFGISQMNHKAGALRYAGQITLTER